MAAPFVGNQDYRGYLNYLGSQGDTGAKNLLNSVGNDAKFGNPSGVDPQLQSYNDQLYGQYNQLNSATGGLANFAGAAGAAVAPTQTPNIGSIYPSTSGGGAPPPVYAPPLDISAIQAQARQSAQSAVNPYYTSLLNDFVSRQATERNQQADQAKLLTEQAAANRDLQQQQIDQGLGTTISQAQKNLADTLAGYDITKGRTIEDVGNNKAQINNQADIFQTDSGTANNTARIAQSRDLATKGLTGGLGAQQTQDAQTTRNTTEARQTDQFNQQKQQQDLFQNRTLDDLVRSAELSKTKEGQTEESAKQQADQGKASANQTAAQAAQKIKFDLDTYLSGQQLDLKDKKNTLEDARQKEIAASTQDYAKLQFNNFVQGISDPAQKLAAVQTYSGSF